GMAMIRDRLAKHAYAIQLPVRSGAVVPGHIDVIDRKQYIFDEDTLGKTFTVVDVPADMKDKVEEARHAAIEHAVTFDEPLMEKYLGGAELTPDEIRHAVRMA